MDELKAVLAKARKVLGAALKLVPVVLLAAVKAGAKAAVETVRAARS